MRLEEFMPRRYDIESAFRSAVVVDPSGRRTLRTIDFVRELKKASWDFSLRDANAWIEASISTFKDISPAEGEARLFMRYNPNGAMAWGFHHGRLIVSSITYRLMRNS